MDERERAGQKFVAALEIALVEGGDRIDELRAMVEAQGPDRIVKTRDGTGNAIYQLLRVYIGSDEKANMSAERRNEVLSMLIEAGVSPEQPCLDHNSKYGGTDLWEWMANSVKLNSSQSIKEQRPPYGRRE